MQEAIISTAVIIYGRALIGSGNDGKSQQSARAKPIKSCTITPFLLRIGNDNKE